MTQQADLSLSPFPRGSARSSTDTAQPAITVCICTIGRLDELGRCLTSIRAGTAQPAAIIVSDDSQSSEVAALCARFGATYQDGPARGLCANRNHVVARVQTSHVTLIDDDAVFGVDFIRDATALLASLGPQEIVTGTLVDGSFRLGPSRPTYLGFFSGTVPARTQCFHLNANVLPHSAFAMAGFDERIEYGYEDMDFAAQLLRKGFVIRCVPELENRHLPGDEPDVRATRVRQERRARFLVALKLRSYRHVRPAPAQAGFAVIATAHAVAHAARAGKSLLTPFLDMAFAWRTARRRGGSGSERSIRAGR